MNLPSPLDITWPDGMDRKPHVPQGDLLDVQVDFVSGMTVAVNWIDRNGQSWITQGKLIREVSGGAGERYWMVKYIDHPGGVYAGERTLQANYHLVNHFDGSNLPSPTPTQQISRSGKSSADKIAALEHLVRDTYSRLPHPDPDIDPAIMDQSCWGVERLRTLLATCTAKGVDVMAEPLEALLYHANQHRYLVGRP